MRDEEMGGVEPYGAYLRSESEPMWSFYEKTLDLPGQAEKSVGPVIGRSLYFPVSL